MEKGRATYIFVTCWSYFCKYRIEWVSYCFHANSDIFNLYHGENKL